MDEIANYSESVFEDIKHVNEYSQDSGVQGNCKLHLNINNGGDFKTS